jgi:hypothetical protein
MRTTTELIGYSPSTQHGACGFLSVFFMGNMRGFSFSLGVRCQFCHAGKEGNKLDQMDFASDGALFSVDSSVRLWLTDSL